jgi:hypothetical protein
MSPDPQLRDVAKLDGLSTPAREAQVIIHHHTLDWHSAQAVCEVFDRLGVLRENLLYSAFPPDSPILQQVIEHGTYLNFKGTIPNLVFCCELHVEGKENTIVQVGDKNTELWDYMDQNASDDKIGVAIYSREAMHNETRCEFSFRNPENKKSALVAIVIFENFGR